MTKSFSLERLSKFKKARLIKYAMRMQKERDDAVLNIRSLDYLLAHLKQREGSLTDRIVENKMEIERLKRLVAK